MDSSRQPSAIVAASLADRRQRAKSPTSALSVAVRRNKCQRANGKPVRSANACISLNSWKALARSPRRTAASERQTCAKSSTRGLPVDPASSIARRPSSSSSSSEPGSQISVARALMASSSAFTSPLCRSVPQRYGRPRNGFCVVVDLEQCAGQLSLDPRSQLLRRI